MYYHYHYRVREYSDTEMIGEIEICLNLFRIFTAQTESACEILSASSSLLADIRRKFP